MPMNKPCNIVNAVAFQTCSPITPILMLLHITNQISADKLVKYQPKMIRLAVSQPKNDDWALIYKK